VPGASPRLQIFRTFGASGIFKIGTGRAPRRDQRITNHQVKFRRVRNLFLVVRVRSKTLIFLKSGKVELLVFLFFGFVAVVATVCSFAESFHPLGNGVVEQTARALLTQ
jgi:hypothetical protein